MNRNTCQMFYRHINCVTAAEVRDEIHCGRPEGSNLPLRVWQVTRRMEPITIITASVCVCVGVCVCEEGLALGF